jgi:prepilin-type processing-associated H-X9-DG protein
MLDYLLPVASVVGPQGTDDWNASHAPRHRGQLNVLLADGSVQRRRPSEIDPRVCEIHDRLWRPTRDGNLVKPNCTTDVSLSPTYPTGASTTTSGESASTAASGGTAGSTTSSTTNSTTGAPPEPLPLEPNCEAPTTGDLLVHYSFNDPDDLGVNDAANPAFDADVFGVVAATDPQRGAVASFDGAGAYMSVLQKVLDLSGESYSLAAWFKTPGSGGQMDIVHANLNASGALLEIQPSGIMRQLHRWAKASVGGTNAMSPASYINNQWHHAAGVKDGAEMRLYIDGALVAQNNDPSRFCELWWIHVGRLKNNTVDTRYFKGLLDDVRIYGRALSQAEVSQLVAN